MEAEVRNALADESTEERWKAAPLPKPFTHKDAWEGDFRRLHRREGME